jgi:hypothetical protein
MYLACITASSGRANFRSRESPGIVFHGITLRTHRARYRHIVPDQGHRPRITKLDHGESGRPGMSKYAWCQGLIPFLIMCPAARGVLTNNNRLRFITLWRSTPITRSFVAFRHPKILKPGRRNAESIVNSRSAVLRHGVLGKKPDPSRTGLRHYMSLSIPSLFIMSISLSMAPMSMPIFALSIPMVLPLFSIFIPFCSMRFPISCMCLAISCMCLPMS